MTTGRTPAEILLGRALRTRLSLVHPCMAQRMSIAAEERVGDHAPRTFQDGQAAYLRDLCPTASSKWVAATIIHKLGPLVYEVAVNGHTRQAHVNHLKPRPETQYVNDAPLENTQPSDGDDTDQRSDLDHTPLVVVTEDSDEVVDSTSELVASHLVG